MRLTCPGIETATRTFKYPLAFLFKEHYMGRPIRDLSKEGPFGRLTVISCVGRKLGGNVYWLCRCECGELREVRGSHLTSANTMSCGCARDERCAQLGRRSGGNNRTHDASGTPTFSSWRCMISRCCNPRHPHYNRYGGRGILVHPRWSDFDSFLADMGERPPGMTLDRIDNDDDYKPGNCRWATTREQHTNMSSNVLLHFDDRVQTIVEWAEELGIKSKTLWSRLNVCGWSVEQALTTPVERRKERIPSHV
jgi:hypothetical protein